MSAQAWTIAGGIVGGVAGHFIGGKKTLWTALGALAGAAVVPSLAEAAIGQLPPSQTQTHTIQLVPGRTIILRAQVGDVVTVLAPSGWGVPSANANVPGFLQIDSANPTTESTVMSVQAAGQGQLTMSVGGETAVLSIKAS